MELRDKLKKLVNAYGVSGNEYDVSAIAAELLRHMLTKSTSTGSATSPASAAAVFPARKK